MLLNSLINHQRVQVELIQPKVWQKEIGVQATGKAIKQAVATIAHGLYPHAELYGPRGGLMDGRADALMIAHYLYITDTGVHNAQPVSKR